MKFIIPEFHRVLTTFMDYTNSYNSSDTTTQTLKKYLNNIMQVPITKQVISHCEFDSIFNRNYAEPILIGTTRRTSEGVEVPFGQPCNFFNYLQDTSTDNVLFFNSFVNSYVTTTTLNTNTFYDRFNERDCKTKITVTKGEETLYTLYAGNHCIYMGNDTMVETVGVYNLEFPENTISSGEWVIKKIKLKINKKIMKDVKHPLFTWITRYFIPQSIDFGFLVDYYAGENCNKKVCILPKDIEIVLSSDEEMLTKIIYDTKEVPSCYSESGLDKLENSIINDFGIGTEETH